MLCPICGKPCEADFVDNGVGNERVGPYRCEPCQWVESPVEFDAPALPNGPCYCRDDEIAF